MKRATAIAALALSCGYGIEDAGIAADILARDRDERRVLLEDGRRILVWGIVAEGDCVVRWSDEATYWELATSKVEIEACP
jgi:hypothetical protein